MHPQSLPAMVNVHRAELVEQAAAHRAARSVQAPRASRLRRRTGWWLVALGLRLAVDERPAAIGSLPGPA